MTKRTGGRHFFAHPVSHRAGVALGFILALSACTSSSSVEDLAPRSASTPAPASMTSSDFPDAPGSQPLMAISSTNPPSSAALNTPVMGGPLASDIAKRNVHGKPADEGRYPNLNIRPDTAAPQLTDEEVEAKKAALAAQRRAASATVPAQQRNAAELNRLAVTHARDTLAEIEEE